MKVIALLQCLCLRCSKQAVFLGHISRIGDGNHIRAVYAVALHIANALQQKQNKKKENIFFNSQMVRLYCSAKIIFSTTAKNTYLSVLAQILAAPTFEASNVTPNLHLCLEENYLFWLLVLLYAA